MPSPFPGMDPYLESPVIWPDVQHGFIGQSQAALNPSINPRYVARVELRMYISESDAPGRKPLIPDLSVDRSPKRKSSGTSQPQQTAAVTEPLIVPTLVEEEVEEAYLKIIHVDTEELVTIIEFLSPTNKIRGSCGRASFLGKRHQVMNSEVHWVEIDLLRAGAPSVTDPPLKPSDYRILVSRADRRTGTRYWPVSVRQPLPVVPIPLRGKDPEVPLDLGEVFRRVYDNAAYGVSVVYRKSPQPPLTGEDAKWARQLLRGK